MTKNELMLFRKIKSGEIDIGSIDDEQLTPDLCMAILKKNYKQKNYV